MNNITNDRRSHRRGLTLIELMATLSILFVMGFASASMLGTIASLGVNRTSNAQTRADVARFARQFRNDVRLSSAAELGDGADSIDLKMDGSLVRYEFRADDRLMTREQTGTPKKAFERFQLAKGCDPEFSIEADYVTARVTSQDAKIPWLVEVLRP